jgi:hypothetical protein
MKLPPELFLAAFAASGGTLKTADVLGERDSRRLAVLSAVASALLFGVLMSESVVSASLILGLFLGVTAARKVDRPNLVVGLMLTFAFAVLLGVQTPSLWLVIVVAVFTVIDEGGHDALGRKEGAAALFFRYRCALKLAMGLLAVLAQIQVLHLVGFLAFDFAYDLVTLMLKKYEADADYKRVV